MLAADAVKPLLLHQDPFIRNAAADWFGEGRSGDPEIVPLILRACDLYGQEHNIHPLAACRRLPVSDAAFDAAREQLGRATNADVISHLNGIVSQAPFGLSQEREAALRRTPNFTENAYQRASRRRDLGARTGDVLWNEVQAYSRRHHERSIEQDYAADLVGALATHGVPDSDTLLRLLAAPETKGEWLEVFLVELTGLRGLRSAAPIVADKMPEEEDDWLADAAEGALARIGDAGTVRLIADGFAGESETVRFRYADLLGLIKVPEAEDALLKLLESERDSDIRTVLCFALCRLFSERGLEAVRSEIRSGYAEWIIRLEDEVLPVADVLGIDFPEKEKWRAERADTERALARRKALLSAEMKLPASFSAPGPASAQAKAPSKSAPAAPRDKIGRNDPCRCGSGKKFKKCCGQT